MGPRKSKWTLDAIEKALHVNMHLHMIYFSKYHPNMRHCFQPDVTVIVTEHLDDLFNYVLSAKFQEGQAEERVEMIFKIYNDRKLPFSWWVSLEEDTPALGSLLQRKGLQPVEQELVLARAKEKGYHMATLEASEQGKKLYEKLGFKECCHFVEYKQICLSAISVSGFLTAEDAEKKDRIFSQYMLCDFCG